MALPSLPVWPANSAPRISGSHSATIAALPPKPLQASSSARQPRCSTSPSGRSKPTPITWSAPSHHNSCTRACVSSVAPARSAAASSADTSAAPARCGRVCMRRAVWPGYRKPCSSSKGRPWRDCSASIAGAMASVYAATRCGAAVPLALAWMSCAKRAALSSATPAARCTRVPAAGMKPEDKAVDPWARASRSSSTQSMPASRSISAAVNPQAPAPTMATGASGVPGAICCARTTAGLTLSDGAGTGRAACR